MSQQYKTIPIRHYADLVTKEDVYSYINQSNFMKACDFCGNERWLLTGEEQGEYVEAALKKNPSGGVAERITTYLKENNDTLFPFPLCMLVCSNCGNVRFFSKVSVWHWKNKTPVE